MTTVSNYDRAIRIVGIAVIALLLSVPSLAQDPWVEFVDETSSRISAASSLVTGDVREKVADIASSPATPGSRCSPACVAGFNVYDATERVIPAAISDCEAKAAA